MSGGQPDTSLPLAPKRPQVIRSHSHNERISAQSIFVEDLPSTVAPAGGHQTVAVRPLVPSKRPSTATGAPERPSRNPARTNSTSLSTITPPAISVKRQSRHIKAGTSTGPIEEVTPWELHPAPELPHHTSVTSSAGSSKPHHSPRLPSLHSSPMHLLPNALVRRRKSLDAKRQPPPPRRTPKSTQSLLYGSDIAPLLVAMNTSSAIASVLPKAPLSPSLPKLTAAKLPGLDAEDTPPPKPVSTDSTPANQFSTADRTILDELRRNIQARAEQFTYKGGDGKRWGGKSAGKKHHPLSKEDAPYPRSYERDVLDYDAWESLFTQQLSGSLTFSTFETPPARVLDIGCGTGTWVLECARAWRDCHLVGLDVVPLHPDLKQVGSPGLASRITWVQSNFLEGLPFPNDEFDYVHIKRIGLGVPEDKWDSLFEEISRIMKPGGTIEVIEEDLTFPGKLPDTDEGEERARTFPESQHELDSSNSGHRSSASLSPRTSDETMRSWASSANSSPLFTTAVPSALASSSLPEEDTLVDDSSTMKRKLEGSVAALLSEIPNPKAPSRAASSDALTDHLLSGRSSPRRQGSLPFPMALPASTMGLMVPPAPPWAHSRLQSSSVVSLVRQDPQPPSMSPRTTPSSVATFASKTAPEEQNPSKQEMNVKSQSMAPPNPRDHSVIEAIYHGMLSSRFINLSPISLLENSMGMYFRDVRSHPTLQLNFPPPQSDTQTPIPYDSETDESEVDPDDDARDAFVAKPSKHVPERLHQPSAVLPSIQPESGHWMSVTNLVRGKSPYVSLDETKVSGFAPSKRASLSALHSYHDAAATPLDPITNPPGSDRLFPGGRRVSLMSTGRNHLPNKTLNIDLQNLNLHLAAKVAEIVACSESMWEWVLELQRRRKLASARHGRVNRARALSVDSSHARPAAIPENSGNIGEDRTQGEIAELSRDEFDHLLSNFELDMRGGMSFGNILQSRFGWQNYSPTPSAERKAFDNQCRQWTKWHDEYNEQLSHTSADRQDPGGRSRTTSTAESFHSLSPTGLPTPPPPSHIELASGFPLFNHSTASIAQVMSPPIPLPSADTTPRRQTFPIHAHSSQRTNRSFRVFVAWKPQDT